MQAFVDALGESGYLLISYLTHSSSRLCIFYLLPMLLLTQLFLLKRGSSWAKFLSEVRGTLYSRWLGRSALQDYSLIVLNALLTVLFFSHLKVLGLDLSILWAELLQDQLGPCRLELPVLFIMCSYTLSLTLIDDLSVYLMHRWMHRSPLLWSFHGVHHSATQLTPLTWLRIHPVEGLLNTFRRAIVYGALTGGFIFLSGGAVSELTLLGVNAFSLIFFVMGASLRHSHLPISYGERLERVLISPLQHQIHLSSAPELQSRNFFIYQSRIQRLRNPIS